MLCHLARRHRPPSQATSTGRAAELSFGSLPAHARRGLQRSNPNRRRRPRRWFIQIAGSGERPRRRTDASRPRQAGPGEPLAAIDDAPDGHAARMSSFQSLRSYKSHVDGYNLLAAYLSRRWAAKASSWAAPLNLGASRNSTGSSACMSGRAAKPSDKQRSISTLAGTGRARGRQLRPYDGRRRACRQAEHSCRRPRHSRCGSSAKHSCLNLRAERLASRQGTVCIASWFSCAPASGPRAAARRSTSRGRCTAARALFGTEGLAGTPRAEDTIASRRRSARWPRRGSNVGGQAAPMFAQ